MIFHLLFLLIRIPVYEEITGVQTKRNFVDIPDSLCQILSVTYLLFSLPPLPKKMVIVKGNKVMCLTITNLSCLCKCRLLREQDLFVIFMTCSVYLRAILLLTLCIAYLENHRPLAHDNLCKNWKIVMTSLTNNTSPQHLHGQLHTESLTRLVLLRAY